MGYKMYIGIAMFVSVSAVYGFYILASRDEIEPYIRAAEEADEAEDETTQKVLLNEQLPEMAVLPSSVSEDEAELVSRAAELKNALLEKETAAELGREYAQTLTPSDFNGIMQDADEVKQESVPLELLVDDQNEEEKDSLPLVYEMSRKRDVPEFFIID